MVKGPLIHGQTMLSNAHVLGHISVIFFQALSSGPLPPLYPNPSGRTARMGMTGMSVLFLPVDQKDMISGGFLKSLNGVSGAGMSLRDRIYGFPLRTVLYRRPTHQPSNSPCHHAMPPSVPPWALCVLVEKVL